jgi:hypothetical protein
VEAEGGSSPAPAGSRAAGAAVGTPSGEVGGTNSTAAARKAAARKAVARKAAGRMAAGRMAGDFPAAWSPADHSGSQASVPSVRTGPAARGQSSISSAASTARAGTSSVLDPRSCRAPVISTISARAAISAAAARSSSMLPNGSAVPCVKTVGAAMWVRCSVRARQHIDVDRAVGDRHRRHPAAIGVPARDHRAVRERPGQCDGFNDARLIQRGGSRRRALRPSPPIRQVVPHREPASAGPFVAGPLKQRRFPAAASAVGQHDCADWGALARSRWLVGDACDLIERHSLSLNSADTGPCPCPNGYAARRHSVTHRLPNATASGTV